MINTAQVEVARLLDLQRQGGDTPIDVEGEYEQAMVWHFDDGSVLIVCEDTGVMFALPSGKTLK